MNETFAFALSCYIRVVIIAFAGQLVGLAICDEMIIRKKSLKVLMTWLVLKTGLLLFQYCWVDFLAPGSYAGQLFVAVSNIWSTLLTGVLFYYTYEGELLKTILGMCLSEIVMSVMLSPCIMLVNLLEGRTNIMDFEGAFQPMDILIFVLVALVYLAVSRVIAPILQKFRQFRIKHKKAWWCFWLGYLVVFQLPTILSIPQKVSLGVFIYIGHLFAGIMILVSSYFIYQRHQRRITRSNEFLQLQKHLMEDQYAAIQQQIGRMEKGRQIVDEQMEELEKLIQFRERSVLSSDEKQNSFRLRISSYLENLRQEYEQLQAGIYCNDWTVDAVLYGKIETAKRQNIEVDCSLQGYDRGVISEEELSQIFLELMDYGIQENRKETRHHGQKNRFFLRHPKKAQDEKEKQISLRAGTVKNQLVIQFFTSCGNRKKFRGTAVSGCVEKYGGIWTQHQSEGKRQIVISLNCKEIQHSE